MNSDKKFEIEAILGKIPDDVFNKFLSMSKQLIDYGACKQEVTEVEDMAVNLDEESDKMQQESGQESQENPYASFKPTDIDEAG